MYDTGNKILEYFGGFDLSGYSHDRQRLMTQGIKLLHSVDWDFKDSVNPVIHTIHPYPAKFIPQIPRKLIELYHPADSSVVLDPFCGSGTTIVEAIDLGLDAIGIDVNPLACLITRAKTTPLPPGLHDVARQVIREAENQVSSDSVQVPTIPRLDHWFKPDIQKVLAALVAQINQEERIPLREALQVALSSIITKVSNQESDTRYAAIDKNVSAEDVFGYFEQAVAKVERAVYQFTDNLFRCLGRATTLNRDLLTVASKDLPSNIGLVITSPPYPNAYEYWLYHKYRMYWLGMNPIDVREQEIGARPHYFKVKHQDERDFERQMGTVFHLLSKVMRPGARACFLVGRSIIHGRVIDNVTLLQRASEPYGFAIEDIVERQIPATRKAFNPANSKINKEHIIVFTLKEKL